MLKSPSGQNPLDKRTFRLYLSSNIYVNKVISMYAFKHLRERLSQSHLVLKLYFLISFYFQRAQPNEVIKSVNIDGILCGKTVHQRSSDECGRE